MKEIHTLNNLIGKEESFLMAMDLLVNCFQRRNLFDLFRMVDGAKKGTIGYGNSIEVGYVNPPERIMSFWDRLTPVIEEITGDKITKIWVFSRIYQNGSVLRKHVDKDGLDWTITVPLYCNLESDWPIYVEKSDKEIVTFGNEVGQGILFKSSKLNHWRDDLNCPVGKYSIHLFLHWKIV